MIKQELLGALDSDVKDVLYVEFDSIPEALRDTEVAIKWIQTSSPQAFSRTANVLEQIPKHLVNDEVRRAAVMTTRPKMKLAMEMYTEDELRPLMNTNRLLRGALLESALGI